MEAHSLEIGRLMTEVDEAKGSLADILEQHAREGKQDPFLTLVGKKGDEYSQDMVELGFKMMSRSLSSVPLAGASDSFAHQT